MFAYLLGAKNGMLGDFKTALNWCKISYEMFNELLFLMSMKIMEDWGNIWLHAEKFCSYTIT